MRKTGTRNRRRGGPAAAAGGSARSAILHAGRREPVQQRSRARVERLLSAARAILERDGMDALTAARVAKEAGVPVGSFYQYFPNKQAVLMAFYQDYLHRTFEMLQKADAVAARASDWRRYMTEYIRYSRAHELRDTVVIELFAAIRSYPELEAIDAQYTEQVVDFLVGRFVALGARATEPRLKRAAHFVFELNNAAWTYQIRAGGRYVERETTQWLTGAVLGVLEHVFEGPGAV